MSSIKKPNPWDSFKPIGDLRRERGEESEGGWVTLLLLNLLAAVFGGFMGLFFHIRVISRATRYSRFNNPPSAEAVHASFWLCICIGVVICMFAITLIWFRAEGRPRRKTIRENEASGDIYPKEPET